MAQSKNSYNGIEVSKTAIAIGDEITITYKGFLAVNGAESLYAHLGYNEGWEDKESVQMKKEKGGFKAKIKVTNPGSLNVCFSNEWNNYDNNDHNNYTFQVAAKKSTDRSTPTKTTNEVAVKTPKASVVKAASTKTAKAAATKEAPTKTAKAATTKVAATKAVPVKTTKVAAEKPVTKTPAKADPKTKKTVAKAVEKKTTASKAPTKATTPVKESKPTTKPTTAKKTSKK